jgi:hypothetical protein
MANRAASQARKAPPTSRRIGRKEFNGCLHKLFGEPGPANILPDYAFSDGRLYHL